MTIKDIARMSGAGAATVPCVLLTNSAKELSFPNLFSLRPDQLPPY